MSARPPAEDLESIFDDEDGPADSATYSGPEDGDPVAVRVILTEDLAVVGSQLRSGEAVFGIQWRKSDLPMAHTGGEFVIAAGDNAGTFRVDQISRQTLTRVGAVVHRA